MDKKRSVGGGAHKFVILVSKLSSVGRLPVRLLLWSRLRARRHLEDVAPLLQHPQRQPRPPVLTDGLVGSQVGAFLVIHPARGTCYTLGYHVAVAS